MLPADPVCRSCCPPALSSRSSRSDCNLVGNNQRDPLFLQHMEPVLVFSVIGKAVSKGVGIPYWPPFTAVLSTRLFCVGPTARLCSHNFS